MNIKSKKSLRDKSISSIHGSTTSASSSCVQERIISSPSVRVMNATSPKKQRLGKLPKNKKRGRNAHQKKDKFKNQALSPGNLGEHPQE